MSNPESEFEKELEVFRQEAESAIQFFYAWRTVNEVAAANKDVVTALNKAPLFWNTTLGALQSSTFIALGRVFDQEKETHNIDRVLRFAQQNSEIFSLDSLAQRKRRSSPNADDWLNDYLKTAYIPTQDDFRRLRKHVSARRKIYIESFRPLRHNVFAHKHKFKQDEVLELYANVKIKDLQQLLIFLRRVYETLWELLYNGRKPVLRPARYSVTQMIAQPRNFGRSLQERLTHETETFLKSIV